MEHRAVERVITDEQRLAVVQAHLAETEAAVGKRQEALGAERMARVHTEKRALSSEQEVTALRGQL